MIELWGRKNAYNVMKPLWMLMELGLEFQHWDVGSQPGDLEKPEFLALNPHARIPVLRDAGAVIWESNSILRYLAARYASGSLWPVDELQRSRAERWMDWELSKLQPDFIALFWNYYRTPVAQRNQTLIEQARRHCELHFRQLDRQLEHQAYIAGPDFTMGDIPVATGLFRYFEMGLAVERPKHVDQWYRRLAQRPAYRDAIMQPFDELQARLEY